jgi:hypothetical protein
MASQAVVHFLFVNSTFLIIQFSLQHRNNLRDATIWLQMTSVAELWYYWEFFFLIDCFYGLFVLFFVLFFLLKETICWWSESQYYFCLGHHSNVTAIGGGMFSVASRIRIIMVSPTTVHLSSVNSTFFIIQFLLKRRNNYANKSTTDDFCSWIKVFICIFYCFIFSLPVDWM